MTVFNLKSVYLISEQPLDVKPNGIFLCMCIVTVSKTIPPWVAKVSSVRK